MAPDGFLSAYHDAATVDPTALPPYVGLAALPQAYRDYLQLNLERHGKLPGVISRVMVKRSLYKSLALHGHHEDDAEEEKRKKSLLGRWLARYIAAEEMLWELMERISSTRDQLDAEIDNLDNQITDLRTLPATAHHLETLEQLERDREKLSKYRERTDQFEANGIAAGSIASKNGIRAVNNGFTEFRDKISNYLANMRAQRHSAGFNTAGNSVSATASNSATGSTSSPQTGASQPPPVTNSPVSPPTPPTGTHTNGQTGSSAGNTSGTTGSSGSSSSSSSTTTQAGSGGGGSHGGQSSPPGGVTPSAP